MVRSRDKKSAYIEAVGRRKTATARVRIFENAKLAIEVNGRAAEDYFATKAQQVVARGAFTDLELPSPFRVTARIVGGGMSAQAEALRHGIARALATHTPELRSALKRKGYLKRDPREKERRKFGLRKARRAPQWSKR